MNGKELGHTVRVMAVLMVLCSGRETVRATSAGLQAAHSAAVANSKKISGDDGSGYSGLPVTEKKSARPQTYYELLERLEDKTEADDYPTSPNFGAWSGKGTEEFTSQSNKRSREPFQPWSGKRSDKTFAPWSGKRPDGNFAPWSGKRSDETFAPWSGKRSSESFVPWSGKRDNFGAWSGKRSDGSFAPWSGKRSNDFAPWSGKRSDKTFGPWSGKRSKANFGAWSGKRSDESFDPWRVKRSSGDFAPWSGKRSSEHFVPWSGKRSSENPEAWSEKRPDAEVRFAEGNGGDARRENKTSESSDENEDISDETGDVKSFNKRFLVVPDWFFHRRLTRARNSPDLKELLKKVQAQRLQESVDSVPHRSVRIPRLIPSFSFWGG